MKMMMVVVAAALALTGCSVVLQERPSKTNPMACSNSRVYPTIDTIAGIVGMAVGGTVLAFAAAKNHEPYVLPGGATLFAGWVGVESGIEGYRMASQCEQRATSGVARR